jgi:hypothetical protein
MVNFQWKYNLQDILPYDINSGNQNVIRTLQWRLIGVDSIHANKTQAASGCISLALDNLSNFTSINEITNETLHSWIISRVGEDEINKMKANIESNINTLPNDWSPV